MATTAVVQDNGVRIGITGMEIEAQVNCSFAIEMVVVPL